MPTRRALMGFLLATSVSPISFAMIETMEAKILPLAKVHNRIEYRDINYKTYLALAISKIDEYIDIHKMELIQLGLIVVALSLILALGIPPTKALILYLIL